MSLWGNNDNLTSAGTVSLNYDTKVVTNSGSNFAESDVGKVLRFGLRGDKVSAGTTYFGDAVISAYTSATQVTIASTAGLTGAAIGSTDYYKSELPVSTVGDFSYSEKNTNYDKIVYGISTSAYDNVSTAYRTSGTGWVGVTTYLNHDGTLRVKSEILVAASGITTGANGILYPTAE